MTRHLITICILLFISGLAFGQDTLVTTGRIFQVWAIAENSNDTIKEKRSERVKEQLNLYSAKKEIMYPIVAAFSDTRKMDKLIRKDKTLRKLTISEIADSYLWGKLDEYDMLFKPGFEIIDDHKNWMYIKCTKGQYNQITAAHDKEKSGKIQVKLKYLGEFHWSGIKGYRLMEYQFISD